MATADLKLVYGGGGSLKPSFFSGALEIASGSSGTLLTITAPAGKLARLTGLVSETGAQSDISVIADGVTVVSSLALQAASGSTAIGGYVIGVGMSSTPTGAGSGVGILDFVEGSVITVVKGGAPTAAKVYYSYIYGD
jgi:hypothetical protein